jgi:4a-hydroxytetrahydrobiopterin dehydratase
MTRLASHQITEYLRDVPAWALHDGSIRRNYAFKSFLTSVAFVKLVAECAEKFQHHPEIDIRFDKVLVMFTTHDVGGLSSKDFLLAEKCDKIFATFSEE